MYHSHDGHINAEKCGNGEKKMISAFKMSANKIGKIGMERCAKDTKES